MKKSLVVAAVAALALFVAALAPAAIQQSSGKVDLGAGLSGSVKAKCKQPNRKGKAKAALVGSGFRGTGSAVLNHGMVPKRKSVKGTAVNASMAPAKATIRAYCARGIKTTVRSFTDKLQALKTHNYFVKCDKGEVALSGGWRMVGNGPAFWTVQGSGRFGARTWVVSVAASEAATLEAYAVCTKSRVDPITRSGPKVQTKGDAITTSTAKCPAGTQAIAGGFRTDVDEGTPFTSAVAPVAALRKGKRKWTSRAYAEQTLDGQYIQAKVVCMS